MSNENGQKPQPPILINRFKALLKQRGDDPRLRNSQPSTEEIAQIYEALLGELTSKVKPIITDLTIIAEKHREHAREITAESLSKASMAVFQIGTDAPLYDDLEDVNNAPLLDSRFDFDTTNTEKPLLVPDDEEDSKNNQAIYLAEIVDVEDASDEVSSIESSHDQCSINESRLHTALQMFDKIPRGNGFTSDVSLYKVLIRGLCENKDIDRTLSFLSEMKESGDTFLGRYDLELVMNAISTDILCIRGSEDGSSSRHDIVNIFLSAAHFSIKDEKCNEEAMSFEDFRSWYSHLPTVRKPHGSLFLPPDSGPGTQFPNLLTSKLFCGTGVDMMKEQFAKLLLGEDISGPGKGVSTALAISNSITNLCGTDVSLLVVKGVYGEFIKVGKLLDEEVLRLVLKKLLEKGINCLVVVLMHSHNFPHHEQHVERLVLGLGFRHVSISSAMVCVVPRGLFTSVDASRTLVIKDYLSGIISKFDEGLGKLNVWFMKSDGGLAPERSFSGHKVIMSGPVGGVVGYSHTLFGLEIEKLLIGFDMGGTSTYVNRYAGSDEQVLKIQSIQHLAKYFGVDWRRKFETPRWTILHTELKAFLASADMMKLGYVSWYHPRHHLEILAVVGYKTKDSDAYLTEDNKFSKHTFNPPSPPPPKPPDQSVATGIESSYNYATSRKSPPSTVFPFDSMKLVLSKLHEVKRKSVALLPMLQFVGDDNNGLLD